MIAKTVLFNRFPQIGDTRKIARPEFSKHQRQHDTG